MYFNLIKSLNVFFLQASIGRRLLSEIFQALFLGLFRAAPKEKPMLCGYADKIPEASVFPGADPKKADGVIEIFSFRTGSLVWIKPRAADQTPRFCVVFCRAADAVIGRQDFISNTSNNGGLSGFSLNGPSSVSLDGTPFFVGDR